ncbi:MAG TPA: hypothetical protein V6C58_12120, partial [Allocoleopsis sp.]
ILLLIIDGPDIWAVFALIFGVVFVGIGSISSLHLQIIGYPKKETAKIFLIITSISLALGFFMGVMIVNFMG